MSSPSRAAVPLLASANNPPLIIEAARRLPLGCLTHVGHGSVYLRRYGQPKPVGGPVYAMYSDLPSGERASVSAPVVQRASTCPVGSSLTRPTAPSASV